MPVDGIDLGRHIVQHAEMRIAGLSHQADLDRHVGEVGGGNACRAIAVLDAQHVLLADGER